MAKTETEWTRRISEGRRTSSTRCPPLLLARKNDFFTASCPHIPSPHSSVYSPKRRLKWPLAATKRCAFASSCRMQRRLHSIAVTVGRSLGPSPREIPHYDVGSVQISPQNLKLRSGERRLGKDFVSGSRRVQDSGPKISHHRQFGTRPCKRRKDGARTVLWFQRSKPEPPANVDYSIEVDHTFIRSMASAPEPSQNAQQTFSSLATVVDIFSKGVAGFAVALYASGFLIVSLHQSEYGFSEVNPLGPRILAAGAWFVLFVTVPAATMARAKMHKLFTWTQIAQWLFPYYWGCMWAGVLASFVFSFSVSPVVIAAKWWVWLIAITATLVLVVAINLWEKFPPRIAATISISLTLLFKSAEWKTVVHNAAIHPKRNRLLVFWSGSCNSDRANRPSKRCRLDEDCIYNLWRFACFRALLLPTPEVIVGRGNSGWCDCVLCEGFTNQAQSDCLAATD